MESIIADARDQSGQPLSNLGPSKFPLMLLDWLLSWSPLLLFDWLLGKTTSSKDSSKVERARHAAENAAWATCTVKATDAARDAAKNAMEATEGAAKDDFTREFIRLCRLEGAYGEVSGRERQSGETPS